MNPAPLPLAVMDTEEEETHEEYYHRYCDEPPAQMIVFHGYE